MEVQAAASHQDLKFPSQPHPKRIEELDIKAVKTTLNSNPNVVVTAESAVTQQPITGAAVSTTPITQQQQPKDSLTREAIELIENEFDKLKAEQLGNQESAHQHQVVIPTSAPALPSAPSQLAHGSPATVVLTTIPPGLTAAANLPQTVTAAAAGDGGQLVYCNLSDLELAAAAVQTGAGAQAVGSIPSVGAVGTEAVVAAGQADTAGYNLTSLASIAEASQSLQNQVM